MFTPINLYIYIYISITYVSNNEVVLLMQLLGATTHEGLDKKMEALLQWEMEWLLLAFNMVSAL